MKISRYNFILYTPEYSYWYNSLTGKFFRITISLSRKIEAMLNDIEILKIDSIVMYNKLLENGFIVDDNFDEISYIRIKHNEAVLKKDYFLMILPTLNCNFKCWYCIQDHIPSIMKDSVIESLKKHIDYMINEEHIDSLRIDWFGGEPFMFFKKIIKPLSLYAIEKCAKHDIPFLNTSTTNGYYINPEVSALLSDLKFQHFQITLDGEQKFHDKVKYIKGCSSAFGYVLNNINTMLAINPQIRIYLRINYTHKTLSPNIISEINHFIDDFNRGKIIVTPKKVWQEDVDKSFGIILRRILDDFQNSGYLVARRDISTTFLPCYVNKKYYNAINFNGNVLKCTACDDTHRQKTNGRLLDNGHIEWENQYDEQCQLATFENERCLNCKMLPVCMGLCPRDYLMGIKRCKYEMLDKVFEEELLDYLINEYR